MLIVRIGESAQFFKRYKGTCSAFFVEKHGNLIEI